MNGDIVSTLKDDYMVFGLSEQWTPSKSLHDDMSTLRLELTFQRIFLQNHKANNYSWSSTPLIASKGASCVVPSILYAKMREKLPDTPLGPFQEKPIAF